MFLPFLILPCTGKNTFLSEQINGNDLLNCHVFSEKSSSGKFVELNLRSLDTVTDFPIQTAGKAYHSPCVPLKCPKAQCDAEMSTFWICNETFCNSYGDINNGFEPKFTEEGLEVTTAFSNHKSTVNYKCDPNLTPEETEYDEATLNDGNVVLTARTGATCPKDYDTAVNGEYKFVQLDHNVIIDMKLQNYTASTLLTKNGDATIYFDPTKPIACPGTTCSDIQSNGWSCTNDNCKSIAYSDEIPNYGIFMKRITDGVDINYNGDDNAQLSVHFKCSNQNEKHLMTYEENSFSYDEAFNRYSLTVLSSDACNVNWDFGDFGDAKAPQIKERPSPIVYETNGTHAIEMEITSIMIVAMNYKLESSLGVSKNVFALITPFVEVACPVHDKCVYANNSEGFICMEKDKCVPILFTRAGIETSIIGSEKNMQGIDIVSPGVGNMRTHLRVKCGEANITTMKYDETGDLYISLYQSDACPADYFEPVLPPTPAPTPEPPAEIPIVSVSHNGKNVIYSNKTVLHGGVVLTADGKKQKITFYVSPGNAASCPENAECLNTTNSSVWKCWSSPADPKLCLPVGDIRWGVDIKGNKVTYKNGYSGYKTTITGICDERLGASVPHFLIDEGEEINKHINLTMHHRDFCEQAKPEEGGKISTSDIVFYCIVAFASLTLALILYLVIGMICIKKKTGKYGIPNIVFWSKIFGCSCCRRMAYASDYVDTDYVGFNRSQI